MEADLQRFYGIDYRDRWRGTLTLRRLWVLLKGLPVDAALSEALRAGQPHWSLEAHLLDDLRIVLTGTDKKPGQPHPSRPRPDGKKRDDAARRKKLADARRRARERREQRQREKGE